MKVYIAILRGINVSGQKKIKMQDLHEQLKNLNFYNTRTYIQSGNIIFESEENNSDKIKNSIENCIQDGFGFDIPVIIRTKGEFKEIIDRNPFMKRPQIKLDKLHVTFLSNIPELDKLSDLKNVNFLPDEFVISGKEVYIYCPDGYGKTKLNNTFFEKKLAQNATTRNWKTVNKLLEITNQE